MMHPLLSASGQAVLWATVSAITFAASASAAKFLGTKLPAAELTFFRTAFGALFLIGVWRFAADLGKLCDPWGYVIRCGLGVVSLLGFMYAVTTIPLALASLLFITRVLLLPVTARVMLGERSGALVWVAVMVGFAGAVISLWPALTVPELRLGGLAALVASVASAGSQTTVRRLTATNSAGLIVLVYTSVSMAATFPLALIDWETPPLADAPILVALGVLAAAAQFAAAKAFGKAPVGFLAPLDFLAFPLAALFGFALFGEIPSIHDAIGGALILLAGLFVAKQKSSESHTA